MAYDVVVRGGTVVTASDAFVADLAIQGGRIAAVTEEHFYYWLEVLPPKFMSGSFFCFAEGAEAFRIFWRDRGQHLARQLTWDETVTFCRLARIPLPD